MINNIQLGLAGNLSSHIQCAIDGLHCRHVGVQNKTKFVLTVSIKIEVNSQRRKILLFLYTNMAAMMSHANHQLLLTIKVGYLSGFVWVIITKPLICFELQDIIIVIFGSENYARKLDVHIHQGNKLHLH